MGRCGRAHHPHRHFPTIRLIAEQDTKVDGYYTLLEEQGPLFAGAPPFPFHAQVREVIDPFIQRAILGELTPADALSQAAMAVDEELDAFRLRDVTRCYRPPTPQSRSPKVQCLRDP